MRYNFAILFQWCYLYLFHQYINIWALLCSRLFSRFNSFYLYNKQLRNLWASQYSGAVLLFVPLTTVSSTRRYCLIKSKNKRNVSFYYKGAIRKIRKLNFPACWALTQSSYAWQTVSYHFFFLIKKLMLLIKMEATVPIQHRVTPVGVTSISADQSSLVTYCASNW